MKNVLIIILATLCLLTTACDTTQSAPPPQELATPQYTVELSPDTNFEVIEDEKIHTAEDDVKIINEDSIPSAEEKSSSIENNSLGVTESFDLDTVWEEDNTVTYNAYTLPEKSELEDGSLGTLFIPEIDLTVSSYEAEEGMDMLEVMDKGAAHFKSTSSWDGNIGLSAHNEVVSGSADYFKDLHTLEKGDTINYTTALGEREYEIDIVKVIADTDWSYLNRTDDNRITLITCVSGQPSNRLMLQATQK